LRIYSAAFAGAALFLVARDICPIPFALFFGVRRKERREKEKIGEKMGFTAPSSLRWVQNQISSNSLSFSHTRHAHLGEKRKVI